MVKDAKAMTDNKAFYQQLGAVVREQRVLNGESQKQLGDILGVTFQQVQKYERGINRLPFHCLMKITVAYKISVNAILKKMEDDIERKEAA